MEIKFPPDRMGAASVTAAVVELESVHMLEGNFKRLGKWDPTMEEIKLDEPLVYLFDEKTNKLQFIKKFSIISKETHESIVSSTYQVNYNLTGDPPPKELREVFLGSYCETYGVMLLWPYWREYVDHSFKCMGIAHNPVPIIHIARAVDPATKPKKRKKEVATKK